MIPAKTYYKTHNSKFFVIIKALKTWKLYLKDCKYKGFILINHNNLQYFININFFSFFLNNKNRKIKVIFIYNNIIRIAKKSLLIFCFLF